MKAISSAASNAAMSSGLSLKASLIGLVSLPKGDGVGVAVGRSVGVVVGVNVISGVLEGKGVSVGLWVEGVQEAMRVVIRHRKIQILQFTRLWDV